MATVGTNQNLLDLARATDPDGQIAVVAEVLSKYNPILQDMVWKVGNLPTGHRFTSRTALPSLTWRKFNQGVAKSKGTNEQIDETTGMLEGISEVDEDMAKLNGNERAYRATQDSAFLQALSIDAATALFYEDTSSNPERMRGLSPRLASTTNNPASAQMILVDSAASGADQTSIWLVGWGDETIFGIVPKGSIAGLQMIDKGNQRVEDGSSNPYFAWSTKFQWHMGLCVKDYRFVVRACNIDTSTWTADLSAGANLVIAMDDMIAAMYSFDGIMPCFYMHRDTFAMLNKQLKLSEGSLLTWLTSREGGDSLLAKYNGIPIKYVDALTKTEAVIS